MAQVTDEQMRERIGQARAYTAVILRRGPRYGEEGATAVVWEHGRRNFMLRDQGVLPIVLPVGDDSEVCGLGVMAVDPERARAVMDEDPGVQAGIFVYDLHPCRGFPGDALPG